MSWSAQFGKSWVIVGGLPAATAATSFLLRVPYVPWYWALTTIPGFSLLKSLVSSSMAGLSTPLIPCQNVIVTGPPAPAGRISEAVSSSTAAAIRRNPLRPTCMQMPSFSPWNRESTSTRGRRPLSLVIPRIARPPSENALDPFAHQIADAGDPQADEEHIHAAAEHAPRGEDAARGAHAEVGEHADDKGRPYGGRAAEQNEGQHGDEGADRRGEPRDPALAQWRHGRGPDPQFQLCLLLQRPLRLAHDLARGPARRLGTHPTGLVEQRELFLFHVGHHADLFLFHGDLVRVDLPLTLRRQEPAAAHRERVGEQPGHPGDQAEVCGQPVVEPIDLVAQKPPGLDPVPGFSGSPQQRSQPLRVLRGLPGQVGGHLRDPDIFVGTGVAPISLHP